MFTAANVDNVGNFTLKTFVIFPQTSAVTNIPIIKSPQYIGHMFIMVQIFSDTNQTEGSKSTLSMGSGKTLEVIYLTY